MNGVTTLLVSHKIGLTRHSLERKGRLRKRTVVENRMGIIDRAEPFVGHTLRVIASNALGSNAREPTFMHLSGRECCVVDDNARESRLLQTDCRLRDADIGLRADEDDGAPSRGLDCREDFRCRRQTKSRLPEGPDLRAHPRVGDAVSLRLLLGNNDRNPEQACKRDQPTNPRDALVRVTDRKEARLRVDDDNHAVLAGEQRHHEILPRRTRHSRPRSKPRASAGDFVERSALEEREPMGSRRAPCLDCARQNAELAAQLSRCARRA